MMKRVTIMAAQWSTLANRVEVAHVPSQVVLKCLKQPGVDGKAIKLGDGSNVRVSTLIYHAR